VPVGLPALPRLDDDPAVVHDEPDRLRVPAAALSADGRDVERRLVAHAFEGGRDVARHGRGHGERDGGEDGGDGAPERPAHACSGFSIEVTNRLVTACGRNRAAAASTAFMVPFTRTVVRPTARTA